MFEEYLLDADWSLNAANWMWLSASAFFHQYFRIYSPIGFGKKTDPRGEYIKKYLPQLKKIPEKYIFEPWTTPLVVQEKAGCIIGKDYPRPIVDHSIVSKNNMAKMKAVFESSKTAEKEDDSYEPPKKKAKDSKGEEDRSKSDSKTKRKSKLQIKPNTKNTKITKFLKKK